MKKEARAGSRKKEPEPQPEPRLLPGTYLPAKSSKLKRGTKQYRRARSGEKRFGARRSKTPGERKQLLDYLSTRSGKKVGSDTKTFRKKIPELDKALYVGIVTQLSRSGFRVEPEALALLRGKMREAGAYLKSQGSASEEIEKAKELLKVFGQNFPAEQSRPISAALMQRIMKRWLPCPPFCGGK